MSQVVRLQQERGISRQKAATLAEVEMLARQGIEDIVLSYPLVGPNIQQAVELVGRFPHCRFAATADDAEMIVTLGNSMHRAGRTIGLLLDINSGRDRTGVPIGETALELYRIIQETRGIEPAGLHLYDGQQGQSDFSARCAAVDTEWERLLEFRDRLLSDGLAVPRLVCGGSPTFPVYARYSEPTLEMSPGTLIFHDAGYASRFPDLTGFTPASLLLTRVVSQPTSNRLTFDVGTKAVASDPPLGQRVVFPEIPDALQVLHNEEHLVIETESAGRWKPGDWTLVIPQHTCPTTVPASRSDRRLSRRDRRHLASHRARPPVLTLTVAADAPGGDDLACGFPVKKCVRGNAEILRDLLYSQEVLQFQYDTVSTSLADAWSTFPRAGTISNVAVRRIHKD